MHSIEKEECVLGAIRTRDLLLRRQPLYPTELREHPGINYPIVFELFLSRDF